MPAQGAHYEGGNNIKNPYEEPTVSHYTAQEIATLQSRLNQHLGPEYTSTRPGSGGTKVHYIEGHKALNLANEVFGFNGWSSALQQVQVDFVDELPNGKISLGLSIIMRITLKDGTYHEDIGYGSMVNAPTKGAAFEKAKKEAATDALKRALRSFGNVLGLCLYDKDYTKKIEKMRVKPVKIHEDRFFRHADFAPPPKKEEVKKEEPATSATEAVDEFGGDAFDSDVIAPTTKTPAAPEDPKGRVAPTGPPVRGAPGPNNGPVQPAMARGQPVPPATRSIGGAKQVPQQQRAQNQGPNNAGGQQRAQNQGPPRPAVQPNNTGANQVPQQQRPQNQGPPQPEIQPNNARGPQTPNPYQANTRPDMQRPRNPTVDIHAPPKPLVQPQPQPQQQNKQPQKENAGPQNQAAPPKATGATGAGNQPAGQRPSVGFVTSRVAEQVQNLDGMVPLNALPAFNPNVDSPIPMERRTPGVDRSCSKGITRDSIGQAAPPQPAQPQLGQKQAQNAPGQGGFRPVVPNRNSTNFVNPHHDTNRRIGMPAAHAQSPLANRGGAYKPPGMIGNGAGIKRPPLSDVSNQGAHGDGPPEPKKARLEGNAPGIENARMDTSSNGTVAEN